MQRSRWAALVLGVMLIAGKLASEQPTVNPDASRLQGTWEIVSMQRGGTGDPSHIGATLLFTADTVTFQPRTFEFDGVVGTGVTYAILIDEKALANMAMG